MSGELEYGLKKVQKSEKTQRKIKRQDHLVISNWGPIREGH
jgi:hypothetical protein